MLAILPTFLLAIRPALLANPVCCCGKEFSNRSLILLSHAYVPLATIRRRWEDTALAVNKASSTEQEACGVSIEPHRRQPSAACPPMLTSATAVVGGDNTGQPY